MAAKQKILIVDDDNNIAELISLYLTKECYDTEIVNDGEDALKAFESYRPNLILLDLMLPGIDGYQVCREIRGKSNVPIIMDSPSTCRQRNSNFCISLPPLRTRCSQGNSFSTTSGAMNTSEIRVPWMSMSNV